MQGGDNFLSVSSVSKSACGVHVVRVSNCFARDAARSAHMGVEGGGSRRGVKRGGEGRGGGSSLLKGKLITCSNATPPAAAEETQRAETVMQETVKAIRA